MKSHPPPRSADPLYVRSAYKPSSHFHAALSRLRAQLASTQQPGGLGDEAADGSQAEDAGRSAPDTPRVLVCCNDAMFVLYLDAALRGTCHLTTTQSLAEGLNAAKYSLPDVLVMDLVTLERAQQRQELLRTFHATLRTVPFLLLSQRTDADCTSLIGGAPQLILEMPVGPGELREAVRFLTRL
ncbi:MAG: hypothetical protein AAGI71_12680 [Bacteroidota bacterium]